MKKISRSIILIFISLILFFYLNYSYEKHNNIFLRHLDIYDGLPDEFPPPKIEDLKQQKEQLESDYKKKLEENNKLKKQIEKNIKYIKILLTTGIIMLSIIIYISIKLYLKYLRKKSIPEKIKKIQKIKKSKINNQDINSENKILSSTNSSIKNSNYNLLNSNTNININISNNSEVLSEINNSQNNKSFIPLEEENNCDAPKMADYSNIVIINDDNKTLTNNPDLFVPSRMDRILYKPYSKEEIK